MASASDDDGVIGYQVSTVAPAKTQPSAAVRDNPQWLDHYLGI